MKIIPPHQVTSHLLEIIHEADKELVLVSPYVDVRYWKVAARALESARARGVRIDFYVRHDQSHDTSKAHVEALGLTPIVVENLHAKFYFNETGGIITSMNLLASSNSNSIEIGCKVETPAELNELRRIVQQHLARATPSVPTVLISEATPKPPAEFGQVLFDFLDIKLDCELHVNNDDDDDEYAVWALNNQSYVTVEHPNNELVLRGIITRSEADRYASHASRYLTITDLLFKLERGTGGQHSMIRGAYNRLLSAPTLEELPAAEQAELLPIILAFVQAVRVYKDNWK